VQDPATAEVAWLMQDQGHDDRTLGASWGARVGRSGANPVGTFVAERGANYSRARGLCAGCTVRPECLEYALPDTDIVGYWAGTTQSERDRMRGRSVV